MLFLACVSSTGQTRGAKPEDIGLDHIILAIDNLARGIDEFARLTGVEPQRGGQHPGRGTENALVSLGGGSYLEILAPITPPPDSASRSAGARPTLSPAGWALHTHDLAGLVTRLRAAGFSVLGPVPGFRRRPDGAMLEWQTAFVSETGLELAPFFIQWAETTPHPSITAPAGCRLVALELEHPEPQPLIQFFLAAGFAASVRADSVAALRVILECPRGQISFSSAPS